MKRKIVITAASILDQNNISGGCVVPDVPAGTATRTIPEAVVETWNPLEQRVNRKIDGFCRKGLAVANRAISESGVLENALDPARVGIFVGNCLGGWGFIEEEIRALHRVGVSAMGPYVATAWFPAALQGQISLHYGFRGHSKTFSAFDVAGVQALAYAAQAIMLDLADVIVCCASEDLSSRYMRRVLEGSIARGCLSSQAFGRKQAYGGAEGAVAFVLEERNKAIARGAPILCELVGCHDAFITAGGQIGPVLASNMGKLVASENDPFLYILDGRFSCEQEETEGALRGRCINGRMITVSGLLGERFSVGGLMEAAIAAQALHHNRLSAAIFGHHDFDPLRQAVVQRLSARGNLTAFGLSAAAQFN